MPPVIGPYVVKRKLKKNGHEAAEKLESIALSLLHMSTNRLLVGGEEVHCTATELRLLKIMMERQGRVQTRERLLEDVWGSSKEVESRTVDTHVRRLRSKLGPEAARVETVVGVGYRFRGN